MDPDPGMAGALLTGSSSTFAPGRGALTSGPAHLAGGPPRSRRHAATGGRPASPAATAGPAATLAHIATLVGAFGFWAWLDRGLWFFGDEWDFIMGRGLSYAPANPESIWFPHNEHWSTLPVLLWRGLYSVFHLTSYWPYILPVLLAQVAVMHLAWRISLRAGADPWVATGAVALLGLLGAGAEDLAWGFQIGFVGSVMFGLLAYDLLERPRPGPGKLAWPAVFASLALLASLMCSTIGVAMLAGAAVVAFARLPRRRALAVLVLPAVAYVAWFAGVGHLGLSAHSDRFTLGTLSDLPHYMWTGLSWALGRAFNLEAAGAAILVGLGAWVVWHAARMWRDQPVLLGLCAATVSFYLLAALGRDTSTGTPDVSRYVYVAMALLVPVIAKVLSPPKAPGAVRVAALALLVVTIIGNVGQAQTWVKARVALTTRLKTDVLGAGQLLAAGAQDVTGAEAAPISYFPNLSAAGLGGLQRSHLLPAAVLTRVDLANARALLAVGDWNGSSTALSPRPLVGGYFDYVRSEHSLTVRQTGNCLAFSSGPARGRPAVQIWLRIPAPEPSASVLVETPPAPKGLTNYLAAVLVPRRGPVNSVPVELVVPSSGSGYLSDNYAPAELVITWARGSALKLCGISVPG